MGQVALALAMVAGKPHRPMARGVRSAGNRRGLPTGDGKEACGGETVPRDEQRVGNAAASVPKGADSFWSDCCEMYYGKVLRAAERCSAAGDPSSFAGLSSTSELIAEN